MNTIYIITGANGFLGNNVIRKLRQHFDGEIRALVVNKNHILTLESLECKVYFGDVTNPDSLNEIFDVPMNTELYVIHCAAYVYIKSAFNQYVYNVNVIGTINVAEKVLQNNGKLIYVSSVHAIPEKPNYELMTEITEFSKEKVKGLYAKTKAETADKVLTMVSEKGLDAIIVHPSGMIGPNDFGPTHTTQLFIDYCNHKLTACVKGGYNFVDVRDVADAIVSACKLGKSGECYILANKTVSIKDMLDIIGEEFGIKKIKTILPMWFAKMTAPLSEVYYALKRQPPIYTGYSLYTLNSNSNFSSEKAKKLLNFKTRDIMETLKDTVIWLLENKLIRIN